MPTAELRFVIDGNGYGYAYKSNSNTHVGADVLASAGCLTVSNKQLATIIVWLGHCIDTYDGGGQQGKVETEVSGQDEIRLLLFNSEKQ